jgi:hypothetical protein
MRAIFNSALVGSTQHPPTTPPTAIEARLSRFWALYKQQHDQGGVHAISREGDRKPRRARQPPAWCTSRHGSCEAANVRLRAWAVMQCGLWYCSELRGEGRTKRMENSAVLDQIDKMSDGSE